MECSNCADKFCHHFSSMWPTPYLEGGDGSNKEDQVCIDIRKWFRKKLSLVFYLFVYVLHLELCILHFYVFHHLSHIHSQVLCIPCLCIYAHCWGVKRIRDVSGLTFMFFKAPSYILHSTLCVCALCMHFLSLQIYLFNFLNYIYYIFVHFLSMHLSLKSLYILHFVFVHYVCIFCLYSFLFV